MKPIGVAVLCYYGIEDAKAAVASIQKHTKAPYLLLVFDNSEDFRIGRWCRDSAAGVHYVRSPYNVGCSVARNRIAEWFAARGVEHFVVMDQDVTVVADGWEGDMLAVFEKHADTGVASWHLAKRQMSPDYKVGPSGEVPEVPGMCCMYSLECVRQAGGWNPQMVMYRFDSLFCLMAAKASFKTRLVWPDTDKVRHNHPHQGIGRNPRWREEQERSRKVFAEEVRRHGLTVPGGLG